MPRVHSLSLRNPLTMRPSIEVSSSPLLTEFDYRPQTRVVFGSGTLSRLGDLSRELGANRVLLVTDSGLEKVGHAERGRKVLEEAGLKVAIFDKVHPNPTTLDVDACVAVAKQNEIDFIVGFGGGSSMDCAKGANFILTNGGQMSDYHGVGLATKPMLPMVAVPTTAGTGSEAQSFALISNPETHMKMACGDRKAACKAAILDPDLTLTMPGSVASATGIDAVTHAVESFVCTRRNPVSQLFARQAWQLLSRSLPVIFQGIENTEARGATLLGAHLAGAAIENSMLGAAHALANPLTAHFGLTHGYAVGLMLPHVVRFNAEVCEAEYAMLAADVGVEGASGLADYLDNLLSIMKLPRTLSTTDVGFDESLISVLAEEATQQWTGQFNPRKIGEADLFAQLYRNAV
ncbi:MAG: iron-containing alcohol dehydrogenase [Planctomycetaceae bacterium]